MKHVVSDATIYPLRMVALVILHGLKRKCTPWNRWRRRPGDVMKAVLALVIGCIVLVPQIVTTAGLLCALAPRLLFPPPKPAP